MSTLVTRLSARSWSVVTMGGRNRRRPQLPFEEQIEKIDPLAVYNIPFDEHIAERDEITWSRLAPATQDAFTHLAAAVVTEANHAINN